jgi:hypothetical protein
VRISEQGIDGRGPFTLVKCPGTYLKIHKKSKGKSCKMDLPLLKNDITAILRPQKFIICNGDGRSTLKSYGDTSRYIKNAINLDR